MPACPANTSGILSVVRGAPTDQCSVLRVRGSGFGYQGRVLGSWLRVPVVQLWPHKLARGRLLCRIPPRGSPGNRWPSKQCKAGLGPTPTILPALHPPYPRHVNKAPAPSLPCQPTLPIQATLSPPPPKSLPLHYAGAPPPPLVPLAAGRAWPRHHPGRGHELAVQHHRRLPALCWQRHAPGAALQRSAGSVQRLEPCTACLPALQSEPGRTRRVPLHL